MKSLPNWKRALGKFPRLASTKRPVSEMPKQFSGGGAAGVSHRNDVATITTVVFQPNSREGSFPLDPLGNRFVARAGGAFGATLPEEEYLTNATTPAWYSGAPDVMVVGMATDFDTGGGVNMLWRGIMRFMLTPITFDQSSIKSGPTPQASWWPSVTAARLKFYVIGAGAPEANPAVPLFTTSDLRIKYNVDNAFYSPTGDENPMGDANEAIYSFSQPYNSPTPANHTIAWADWGANAATLVTVNLPQTAIDLYLKEMANIYGSLGELNPFLEVALLLERDLAGTDFVNFKVEIAAWGVNQPTLEIDFSV